MDLLTAEQARVVLRRPLTPPPALRQEADLIAVDLLEAVDTDSVADAVVGTFQRLPFTAIAQRAGRQPGGYVHETDAGWELLDHTLQPWRDDLARLAGAGLDEAAQRVVLGVVAGLHRLIDEAHPESLLGWMDAGEAAADLADHVLRHAAVAGVVPPAPALCAAAPTWYA